MAAQKSPSIGSSLKQVAIERSCRTYYDPLIGLAMGTVMMLQGYHSQKTLEISFGSDKLVPQEMVDKHEDL